nr:hypothetical protein [Aeromonas veronii]
MHREIRKGGNETPQRLLAQPEGSPNADTTFKDPKVRLEVVRNHAMCFSTARGPS